MTSVRTLLDRTLSRLALVGADPSDDEDTRLRHRTPSPDRDPDPADLARVVRHIRDLRRPGRLHGMVAAGVPDPRPDHAKVLARLALDMAASMAPGGAELLGAEFVCERRGTVSVKGKGDMETWYLLGRREAVSGRAGPFRASGGTP